MKTRAEDSEREERIQNEATVDAHDPEEQAMGWYYYLDDKLECPFTAECRAKRSISPLEPGEHVRVVGMAPAEECEKEMFAMVEWQGRTFAVPLSQLSPTDVTEDTAEAVEDWHYWAERGYQF